MKKNVASQSVGAQMVTAADGSAFGSTVTVYVTGNAGTQAIGSVGSGICTHEGNGFYTYAPAQAETNYDHVAFTFIGSGAVPVSIQTYPTFPQTGDSFARIGAPAGASISADIDALPTAVENADALLNRDMSSGTDSGSPSVRTVRQALRFLRNKWSISGTTLTVTKEDDSTSSWTSTVTATAGADPITGNDPA